MITESSLRHEILFAYDITAVYCYRSDEMKKKSNTLGEIKWISSIEIVVERSDGILYSGID